MAIDASVMWRWAQASILVGMFLLAFALILPAVQQAREAARRTQSKNNLKQLGLALENYHETHRSYPPGGTFDANARGQHGWITFAWCFLESTPYYIRIDFNQPWDAPCNAGFFQHQLYAVLNPSIGTDTPKNGFTVSHYSANSNLLAANSSVARGQIEDLSNTFMAGELGGDFIPWASPYNWRPLVGLTNTPRTYGRLENYGGNFLMADVSVRWVGPELSRELRTSLNGPDLAVAARGQFEVVRPEKFPFPDDALIPHSVAIGGNFCFGMRNTHDELVELELDFNWMKSNQIPNDADLKWVKNFRHLVRLMATGHFTDVGASSIAALTQLEELSLSSDGITDEGLSFLRSLPKLRKLTLSRLAITPELIKQIEGLSKLEILSLSTDEVTEDLPELLHPFLKLKNLELSLNSDNINDDSLQIVAQVEGLDELAIWSNRVTNNGLLQLSNLHGLSRLSIQSEKTTTPGIQRLQEFLPNCKIHKW